MTTEERTCHVRHRTGTEDTIPVAALPTLLAELDEDPADIEHPDVSVRAQDSEWSMSAFPSGYITWENLEDGEPRHMPGLTRPEVLRLFTAVAHGDFGTLESQPWQPGYGT